jgi:hypothetical protein
VPTLSDLPAPPPPLRRSLSASTLLPPARPTNGPLCLPLPLYLLQFLHDPTDSPRYRPPNPPSRISCPPWIRTYLTRLGNSGDYDAYLPLAALAYHVHPSLYTCPYETLVSIRRGAHKYDEVLPFHFLTDRSLLSFPTFEQYMQHQRPEMSTVLFRDPPRVWTSTRPQAPRHRKHTRNRQCSPKSSHRSHLPVRPCPAQPSGAVRVISDGSASPYGSRGSGY